MSLSHSTKDIELDALCAEARIRHGEALLQQGQHEAALAIADEVLAKVQGLDCAILLRGSVCRALGRFGEAAEAFRILLTSFPDFTAIRINLANACIELEEFCQAEVELREAIKREPGSAAAHATLGSLYLRLDRYDLAEAPTRQALSLDSSIIIAHQNMAAILALRGDPEAEFHRDAAYVRQQIFVESGTKAPQTALILTGSGSGNVPYQYLLPRTQYNRILWHLEYAPPAQGKELPAHDFVFNAIGDPDAAGKAQSAAERIVSELRQPLINRPNRVARTLRSAMPGLLAHISGAVMPDTRRFTNDDGNPRNAILSSGLRFPLILRPAGRHGGEGVRLVRSAGELGHGLAQCQALYATEFVDYRSMDGWYRKYRMIFVDREPYPYHLAIGARWLLHYKSADMEADPERCAEEAAFLRDPAAAIGPRAMAALREIASRIDLDFAGIDFSLLPDGRVLFFEANATMLVHPEQDEVFAYKNQAVSAIVDAVTKMISRHIRVGADGEVSSAL
jgi:tetratricopeptide (TPR) repeat protein